MRGRGGIRRVEERRGEKENPLCFHFVNCFSRASTFSAGPLLTYGLQWCVWSVAWAPLAL